ncbi:hypothetical protein GCM10011316_25250 [Roseibium aquae]|uniref:Uncharacterized protein n=1 Tax=Roseibium aquae TaxID=1323746 RepID=A0A916TLB6_9HYPH|nr:hypothetical protein [Roseibium aquae]GGB52196.1 hypothetical protein GCM10011316_25250 [Roseibium aquae]
MLETTLTAVPGGIGIGAIAQSLVQHWLANKKYNREGEYKAKREAYLGFLNAISKSETTPNQENSITGGHWINRCLLVCSEEIDGLLTKYLETNPVDQQVHPEWPIVFSPLLNAMRSDLKRT